MNDNPGRLDTLEFPGGLSGVHGLRNFITATMGVWRVPSVFGDGAYAIELLVARTAGANFEGCNTYTFGQRSASNLNSEAEVRRCLIDAHGMNQVCLITGMDSHEAIATWQGLLIGRGDEICALGGAVIDVHYGLCVAVNGLRNELQCLFVARMIRNLIVMAFDMAGIVELQDDGRS